MSLMQMDLDSKAITPLWETDDHTQMAHPVFSSAGSQLTLSAWVEGGFQDIYTMNSDGSNRRALTFDKATDSSPAWSPDDAYIFFHSDRTGVPNIFAYHLETNALYQVTNVLTGAFNPAVSPDNEHLVFEFYSSNGLDIHMADIDRKAWHVTPLDREELPDLPPYSRHMVILCEHERRAGVENDGCARRMVVEHEAEGCLHRVAVEVVAHALPDADRSHAGLVAGSKVENATASLKESILHRIIHEALAEDRPPVSDLQEPLLPDRGRQVDHFTELLRPLNRLFVKEPAESRITHQRLFAKLVNQPQECRTLVGLVAKVGVHLSPPRH